MATRNARSVDRIKTYATQVAGTAPDSGRNGRRSSHPALTGKQDSSPILAALASLANGAGYLKNDGSGGLSWEAVQSYSAETLTWWGRVVSAGGAVNAASVTIANDLSTALAAKTYSAKIVYLLPLLGVGINAARIPLRDSLNVGAAGNSGFVDADFADATGLDNASEGSKRFDSLIKPSALGTSNNGGLGWWEGNIGFGSGVEPIGCYNNAGDNRYVLDLRSTLQKFPWGAPSNGAGPSTTAGNGHYYGQRSSSTLREIYKNGVSLGSNNTTSDSTSGASDRNIWMHGANETPASYWKGRCLVAYLTDGTMSSGDISDFHTLLSDYLITPTGR